MALVNVISSFRPETFDISTALRWVSERTSHLGSKSPEYCSAKALSQGTAYERPFPAMSGHSVRCTRRSAISVEMLESRCPEAVKASPPELDAAFSLHLSIA